MNMKTIGVDFGGTTIKIGVTRGVEICERAEPLPTPSYGSPAEIMDAMCATIRGLMEHHPEVQGIGLGMPGWVDFGRGVLYQLTNVPVWNKPEPVREVLTEQLGLPVVLDNDAKCMAYAEWKEGAGRGYENLHCITLGTGVGGALIINNRMVRGRRISAAEIGQTSICFDGRVGPFGNRGALEEYIGNNEVAADAAALYAAAGTPKSPEECTPLLLEKAARAGDPIAQKIYNDFAEKLACHIMNIMYTVVPDAFIIGGGVAKAGDLLFTPLRDFLKRQLFPVHYEDLRLLPAHFGASSGLIGAGLMARDYVLGVL